MTIQMAISRTREYDADEDGSTLTGDPLALASALRKLESGVARAPLAPQRDIVNASHMMIANPFRAQDVSSCSPPTRRWPERIARLESMATGSTERASRRRPRLRGCRPWRVSPGSKQRARAALIDVTSYDVDLDLDQRRTDLRVRGDGAVPVHRARCLDLPGRPAQDRSHRVGRSTAPRSTRPRCPTGGCRWSTCGRERARGRRDDGYSHDGQGLHRASTPPTATHYVYGHLFLDAAPRVYGCFDQPDLKAPYDVRVTTPGRLGGGRQRRGHRCRWARGRWRRRGRCRRTSSPSAPVPTCRCTPSTTASRWASTPGPRSRTPSSGTPTRCSR